MDRARGLLSRYGSLSGLAGRGIAELAAVRGVGPVKAVRLAAAVEITRRLRSRDGPGRGGPGSPAQAVARYGPLMEVLPRDVCRVQRPDPPDRLLPARRVS